MDAFHEEVVTKANKLRTKDVKPDLACDLNEIQLNLETILMMQLASIDIITNGQAYEAAQQDLACMLVEYEAPRFIHEGGTNLTQPGDAKYGSLLTFGYYKEEMK